MMTSTNIVFLCFLLFISGCYSLVCDEAFQCRNQSHLDISSTVDCNGFYSCGDSSLSSNSPSSGEIYCRGSHACYKSSLIQTIDSGEIYCWGFNSCALVEYIWTQHGPIHCTGEKSCYNSILYGYQNRIHCTGTLSCANSYIFSSQPVSISGYLSGYNSTFITGDKNAWQHFEFWFYGEKSGYNAKVICGDQRTCRIHCNANACSNLQLTCDGTCYIEYFCDYAEKSDFYPLGYQTKWSQLKPVPDLLDLTKSLSIDVDNYTPNDVTITPNSPIITPTASKNMQIECDDYEQCSNVNNSIIINVDNNTESIAICCRGYNTCSLSTFEFDGYSWLAMNDMINISIEPNYTQSEYTLKTTSISIDLYCDGRDSCNNINLQQNWGNFRQIYFDNNISYGDDSDIDEQVAINKIVSFSLANVYYSGFRSCSVTNPIDFTMGPNGTPNIFCTAENSCCLKQFNSISNLYCLASASCTNLIGNNINGSILCYGAQSCQFVNVSNIVNGNVYCSVGFACSDSIIVNVNGSVFGYGYEALGGSTLINAQNVSVIPFFSFLTFVL